MHYSFTKVDGACSRVAFFGRTNLKACAIQILFGGATILWNFAIIAAADSPFTTHPENTWLKQSPREGGAEVLLRGQRRV
jgi:hypothetical protein